MTGRYTARVHFYSGGVLRAAQFLSCTSARSADLPTSRVWPPVNATAFDIVVTSRSLHCSRMTPTANARRNSSNAANASSIADAAGGLRAASAPASWRKAVKPRPKASGLNVDS